MDFELHMRNKSPFVYQTTGLYLFSPLHTIKLKLFLQATNFGCSFESKSGLIQEQWVFEYFDYAFVYI